MGASESAKLLFTTQSFTTLTIQLQGKILKNPVKHWTQLTPWFWISNEEIQPGSCAVASLGCTFVVWKAAKSLQDDFQSSQTCTKLYIPSQKFEGTKGKGHLSSEIIAVRKIRYSRQNCPSPASDNSLDKWWNWVQGGLGAYGYNNVNS